MTISVQNNAQLLTTLDSLNRTANELSSVQDGGASAATSAVDVQGSAILALTSAQPASAASQLNNGLSQAASAADSAVGAGVTIANLLTQMQQEAQGATNPNLDSADRASLNSSFQASLAQIGQAVTQASSGGVNLVDGSQSSGVQVPTDTAGASTVTLSGQNLSLGGPVVGLSADASLATPADAAAALSAIQAALPKVGAAVSEIVGQSASIQSHMGILAQLNQSLGAGLGGQVNTSLDLDGARLQALSVQQQLSFGGQSIANQAPAAILSLFR